MNRFQYRGFITCFPIPLRRKCYSSSIKYNIQQHSKYWLKYHLGLKCHLRSIREVGSIAILSQSD